jgi:hypothetical protein
MKIYTFVNNKPDLLELQLRSFERHLKEPFEFIVINNAAFANPDKYPIIVSECRRLGLSSIDVQFDRHLADRCEQDSGDRVLSGDRYTHMTMGCGYGVRWAWEKIITKQTGNVLVMHHDMFLMQPTVLSDYLKDAALMFVPQIKPGVPVHIWEGFFLANLDILPQATEINWSYGWINGERVDVGGMSHYWFQFHPDVKWKGINPIHTEDTTEVDFHPALFEYLHFDGRPLVLHYRAASDWMKMGKEYHDKKTAWLRRQLA